MAGCFGSHPFDRAMEQSLYRHLGWEADYEALCEELCKDIPDDLWDKYEDFVNKVIDKYLGPKVEKGRIPMEDAKRVLLWMVRKIDENKINIKRG